MGSSGKAGCDVWAKDNDVRTLAHLAAGNGHGGVLRLRAVDVCVLRLRALIIAEAIVETDKC